MNKFLIIGDSCTDIHIYGKCNRLSPEAPVPILNPVKIVKNGGMAKNVKSNLIKMGAQVEIITNPNNIKKMRYVDEHTNAMLLRVDENDYTDRVDLDKLKKVKNNCYDDYKFDGLIISDYCKGFLEEEDIKFLIRNNSNVFLDTKKILGEWMYDVDFVKINQNEFNKTKNYIDNDRLISKLIITKGSKGCQYKDKVYSVSQIDGVKDYSGAGDTFLSGFAFKYLNTFDIESSINYAQECATIVVQKHGVATI
jgi:D-beta-D-heptose 7-phosphate kinase/D-beta-D-heptose 1-phosphate adenosyltransferase